MPSEGRAVALLGQSMGGKATLAVAARLGTMVRGVARWSPGPMLAGDSASAKSGWMEEEGQRVRWDFWREAEAIDFMALYRDRAAPVYMVFGTADTYITVDEMKTVEAARREGDRILVVDALPHSAWPEPHRTEILRETREFLTDCLGES